jgi:hypothetical protein
VYTPTAASPILLDAAATGGAPAANAKAQIASAERANARNVDSLVERRSSMPASTANQCVGWAF